MRAAASAVLEIGDYIAGFADSALAPWRDCAPWVVCARSAEVVRTLLGELRAEDYVFSGDMAVHRSARIESGAVLKGPLILGARCFVAAGAYLRGGNWVAEDCSLGPGVELKSSFVFRGTHLAHFNFVGDSILGAGVNLEAGAIVCNHRNERVDKEIRVRVGEAVITTGCEKFGALIGDGVRLGANAVVAPGTLLRPATIIGRAALCDQETDTK